tara:strand:+ start:102 stop:344 length:243 start_codon:yes stop_codon:yes gene_type:complete
MTQNEKIITLRAAVAMALRRLQRDREDVIESNSLFQRDGDEFVGVPDSLDPVAAKWVAEYDTAIRQCEAALKASEQVARP